jgi:hypothetical protein
MVGTCTLSDEESLSAFEELNHYNLAFETSSGSIRLSSSFQLFLDMSLKTDKNILSNIDVGGFWRSILHNLDQMNRSERQGAYVDTDMYERTVIDGIYQLIDGVNQNIYQLRTRLDNKFGYVSSISAKRKENEQAIIEAKSLREALGIIDSAEIYERLPNNSRLVRIINVDLLQGKQNAQNELLNALSVLQDLLLGFRKVEGRARLIKVFKSYYDNNTEHDFSGLFPLQEKALLNPLINLVKPIPIRLHPDETNPLQRDALVSIIESLSIDTENESVKVREENCELDTSDDDATKDIEVTPSELWLQSILITALQNPKDWIKVSTNHQQDSADMPLNVYLDLIYSEWLRLPAETAEHYTLNPMGYYDPVFNGNFSIVDLEITLVRS